LGDDDVDMFAEETEDEKKLRLAAHQAYCDDPYTASEKYLDQDNKETLPRWCAVVEPMYAMEDNPHDGEVEKLKFRMLPDADAYTFKPNEIFGFHKMHFFPKMFAFGGSWDFPSETKHAHGLGHVRYYWTVHDKTHVAHNKKVQYKEVEVPWPFETNKKMTLSFNIPVPVFEGHKSKRQKRISVG